MAVFEPAPISTAPVERTAVPSSLSLTMALEPMPGIPQNSASYPDSEGLILSGPLVLTEMLFDGPLQLGEDIVGSLRNPKPDLSASCPSP